MQEGIQIQYYWVVGKHYCRNIFIFEKDYKKNTLRQDSPLQAVERIDKTYKMLISHSYSGTDKVCTVKQQKS